jgi:hypothetical protein
MSFASALNADLSDSWFKEAVVEKWRGGIKLVPNGWLTGEAAGAP